MSGELPGFRNPVWIIFETEFTRLIKSRKLKVLFIITLFPSIIYLLNPNPSGTGSDAMVESFETLMIDLLPNYWLGIIGQFIAIILMSDLLASEIDKGTIRLLLARPVRHAEIVISKFLAGLAILTVLYGSPYSVIWLYNPLVYGAGLEGLWNGLPDLLLVLGATLLILALLGSLAMMVSVIITRPLYASLAAFGAVFLLEFLIPQIPYIGGAEQYTITYQVSVILNSGFNKLSLPSISGDPLSTLIYTCILTLIFIVASWIILSFRDFPG